MRVMIVAGKSNSLVSFRGDLIKAITENGHHVVAVGSEPGYEDQIAELGARFCSIPLSRTGTNPLADLIYLWRLFLIIRSETPDLVLSYTIKPVIFGSIAARLAGVRRIYAMITGLGYIFTGGRGRDALMHLVLVMYRIAFAACRKVIFQNPDDMEEFVERGLVPSMKAVLVNGSGVNLDRYQPQPVPKEHVFLMICRLLRDKGVMEYMQAARLVKQSHPEARFVLVGPFDSNPSAVQMSDIEPFASDGSVEYMGQVDDVRPFLKQCRVYVLPSYREGTPRTVLEAMATGRAVITTDAPGCRETVIDGKNGFLVPLRNSAVLAERMMWMIDYPETAERMGAESLHLCREKYDVKKVNSVILQLLSLE